MYTVITSCIYFKGSEKYINVHCDNKLYLFLGIREVHKCTL